MSLVLRFVDGKPQVAELDNVAAVADMQWREPTDEELASIDHTLWGTDESVFNNTDFMPKGGVDPGPGASDEEPFVGGRAPVRERIYSEFFDTLTLGKALDDVPALWRAFAGVNVGNTDLTNCVQAGVLGYGHTTEVRAWRIRFAGDLDDNERRTLITGLQAQVFAGEKVMGRVDLFQLSDTADLVTELRGEIPTPSVFDRMHGVLDDVIKDFAAVDVSSKEAKDAAMAKLLPVVLGAVHGSLEYGIQLPPRQSFRIDVTFSKEAREVMKKVTFFRVVAETYVTRDVC